MNNKPMPTPGPLVLTSSGMITSQARERNSQVELAVVEIDWDEPFRSEQRAAAQLLVEAYNAIQSAAARLNVHPVELAEALGDGVIAELVGALQEIANWPDGGNRYGQDNIKRFGQGVLAKLPKPADQENGNG
jgi:hypothetical protein